MADSFIAIAYNLSLYARYNGGGALSVFPFMSKLPFGGCVPSNFEYRIAFAV